MHSDDTWQKLLNSTDQSEIDRELKRAGAFQFGIDFLDDAMFGVFRGDLVLIGGQSGIGKTQLACNLASSAAAQGKKVFYFALEAERGEIELRMLFQQLKDPGATFGQYMTGANSPQLKASVERALNELKTDRGPGGIYLYYKTGNFGAKDLEREILSRQMEADVFIVDHFHFLDHDFGKSEQDEHKRAIRLIRDTALSVKKPVVLLAHMNKAHAKSTNPIPGMYDFYGTADLINVATKIVTITNRIPDACKEAATGMVGQDDLPLSPTAMQICKHRADGSVTNYLGLVAFSRETGRYRPGYFVSLNPDHEPLSRRTLDFPEWARRAKSYETRPYVVKPGAGHD